MAQPCAYIVLSKELLSKFHLEQRMNKQKKESYGPLDGPSAGAKSQRIGGASMKKLVQHAAAP